MATNIIFTRGNTATINATAITDGQILYNTTTGTQYLDNGTTRLQIGQNITVDATLNSSSNNPIANSGVAGVMYTSLSEISTITQAGNIPDALAVKELNSNLGNISTIGNTTYNSVEKLLQYYIDNGYLPDLKLLPFIPIMNSNTTPSGIASCLTQYSTGYEAWRSLNNSVNSTCMISGSSGYFQYEFPTSKVVKRIISSPYSNAAEVAVSSFFKNFNVKASNDGTTFATIYSGQTNSPVAGGTQQISIGNTASYKYYRIEVTTNWGNSNYTQLGQLLQMYGV